jgi:hypothetical protein
MSGWAGATVRERWEHCGDRRLTAETAAIGELQGRLRSVHLSAHLETRAMLNLDQIARYEQLRGYGGPAMTPQLHRHHG